MPSWRWLNEVDAVGVSRCGLGVLGCRPCGRRRRARAAVRRTDGLPRDRGAGGAGGIHLGSETGEEQELRQVDDREAGVYYTDPGETRALAIKATAAHDAIGTAVPTTIAVTQPNIITLTVHHRDGNPAAGGTPFTYPIIAGEGWEGGFQTYWVVMPPGELPQATPADHCIVPDLGGRTLRASRKMLRRSHCKLGEVRGERSRGARVVRQFRPAGKSLPFGTEVGLKIRVL